MEIDVFNKIIRRFGVMLGNALNFMLMPYLRQYFQDYPLFLAMDTLVGNEIEGDYYEFGVFRGRSMSLVFKRLRASLPKKYFKPMRFVAFDSFQGLPQSHDTATPAHYHQGAYAAPRRLFERNMRRVGLRGDKLVVVPGFYDQSLNAPETQAQLQASKVALCYIDCDIYESTVSALDFLTDRLQQGSMLVLDDWNRHRVSDSFGLRRAVKEWLGRNPHIRLTQMFLSKRVLFAVDIVPSEPAMRETARLAEATN